MSQNLVVNFIGENKLSKTTAVVSRDLKNLGRTGENVGRSLNKALGAFGLALGVQQLSKVLKESAKAAVEDSKSKELLALSLRNTIGATKATTDAADKWISKTQLATSVLDSQLRPALAQTVASTGSLAGGQKLLNLALNVSAYAQKDLGAVTKALTKAQNGQYTGLNRLGLGTKFTAGWFEQLTKQTKGAAEAAANADPFQRLSIIFDEIKETIGYALLPYLQEMANYLASPAGQRELKKVVRQFVLLAKAVGQVIGWLTKHAELVRQVIVLLVSMKIAWGLVTFAVNAYTVATKLGITSTKALKLAIAATGIGLLIVAVAELATAWMDAADSSRTYREQNANFYGTKVIYTPDEIQKRSDKAFADRWIAMGAFFAAKVKTGSDKVQDALDEANKNIKKTAESFRDSVGLAFGTFGKDENSVFNVDYVIAKLRRMVDAARGFKDNLDKLTKAGAGADVKAELIAMGPAQGNIVAKGLLSSGRLSEYLGLRGSLYSTGMGVGGVQAGEATYNINVNKANMSAEEIIRVIRAYEKTNRRRYFSN
jgi:hypothetical protein